MKSKFEKLWNIVQKRINNNREYKVPCFVATPEIHSKIILDETSDVASNIPVLFIKAQFY